MSGREQGSMRWESWPLVRAATAELWVPGDRKRTRQGQTGAEKRNTRWVWFGFPTRCDGKP